MFSLHCTIKIISCFWIAFLTTDKSNGLRGRVGTWENCFVSVHIGAKTFSTRWQSCSCMSPALVLSPQANTHKTAAPSHMLYSSQGYLWRGTKCSSKVSLASWIALLHHAWGSIGRVGHHGKLLTRTFGHRACGLVTDKLVVGFDGNHGHDLPCPWAALSTAPVATPAMQDQEQSYHVTVYFSVRRALKHRWAKYFPNSCIT